MEVELIRKWFNAVNLKGIRVFFRGSHFLTLNRYKWKWQK